MLTPQQREAILAKLKSAGIKYQEVYEELVDHYSSAIEVKIKEGSTFGQALEAVHTDFGGNKGVKHVQEQFWSQMVRFYRNLHWQNFRQHFQWPQALLTLCMGGLVYTLSFLLKGNAALFYGLSLLAFSPFILSAFHFYQLRKKATYSKKTAKGNLLLAIGGYGLNVLNILVFVPRVFFNGNLEKDFILLYPAFVSVVITLYLLHLLSFIKTLERVQFKTS